MSDEKEVPEKRGLPPICPLTLTMPTAGMAVEISVKVEDARELAYHFRKNASNPLDDEDTVKQLMGFLAAQPMRVSFHPMEHPYAPEKGRIVVPGS